MELGLRGRCFCTGKSRVGWVLGVGIWHGSYTRGMNVAWHKQVEGHPLSWAKPSVMVVVDITYKATDENDKNPLFEMPNSTTVRQTDTSPGRTSRRPTHPSSPSTLPTNTSVLLLLHFYDILSQPTHHSPSTYQEEQNATTYPVAEP